MTLLELKDREKQIRTEADKQIDDLRALYTLAKNPYQIGDILRDHYHIIRVEKIMVYCVGNCCYRGVELKKDLTPKKRQSDTSMYQSNVEEKIS